MPKVKQKAPKKPDWLPYMSVDVGGEKSGWVRMAPRHYRATHTIGIFPAPSGHTVVRMVHDQGEHAADMAYSAFRLLMKAVTRLFLPCIPDMFSVRTQPHPTEYRHVIRMEARTTSGTDSCHHFPLVKGCSVFSDRLLETFERRKPIYDFFATLECAFVDLRAKRASLHLVTERGTEIVTVDLSGPSWEYDRRWPW